MSVQMHAQDSAKCDGSFRTLFERVIFHVRKIDFNEDYLLLVSG